MVSPHLLLWPLAEDLFAEAKRIASHKNTEIVYNSTRYCQLIATGLGCLEALLNHNKLEPHVEICTRFRMAEVIFYETNDIQKAEQILNKGVILAQTHHETMDMTFTMQHLLIRILSQTSPKAAKVLLKSCIEEAETHGAFHWIYIFCFLQFNILSYTHQQDNEYAARLSALSKIMSVSQDCNDHVIQVIASLLEVYVRIEMGDYSMAKECLDRLSTIQTIGNDISTFHIIKMIFSIFLYILQGHGDTAIFELKNLHHALDELAQHDASNSYQDAIELSLDPKNSSKLTIHWFNRQQLFVYGHLLSGICYLPNFSSSKAEIFFNEGLEMLKCNLIYDLSLPTYLRTNRNSDWFSNTREICLIYYCFALLLKSNFDKAFKYIQILEKYSSSSSMSTKALFTLLKGTYAQFTGQLDIALKAYDLIPTSLQTISLLGNLNSVLIFQGNKLQDKKRAHEILVNIKSLCQSSNFTQLRFAWSLVNGSSGNDVLHSKNCLSSVITASEKYTNNQLRVIALISMCYYFIIHSENEHVEKMLITAYLLSKNAENDLWAFMSGKLLEELMKKKNRKIKAEKQLQLNIKHKERILNMFGHTHAISIKHL